MPPPGTGADTDTRTFTSWMATFGGVRTKSSRYAVSNAAAIASREAIAAAFETAYRELFVRTPPNVAIQLVNVRVSVSAPVPGGGMALRGTRSGSAAQARKGARQVYFPDAGGFVAGDVYDRYRLPVGARLEGPAVVEEKESTFVFGPGAVCDVHESGSLVVTLPAAEA